MNQQQHRSPPVQGRECGAQQSGLAWSHLVGTFAGLSTAVGHFGLLWPREGGFEPPGEEMGARGSGDGFLSHEESDQCGFGERATGIVSSAAVTSRDLSQQAHFTMTAFHFLPRLVSADETRCW